MLLNQVDSCYRERQNFRLTFEVKEKSTEKLRIDPQEFDPQEFCGRDLSEVL